MKTNKKYASVFELNGVPKFSQAFPLALQHVVAMIVGCVTPAIVIAGMAGDVATPGRTVIATACALGAGLGEEFLGIRRGPRYRLAGPHRGRPVGRPTGCGVAISGRCGVHAVGFVGQSPAIAQAVFDGLGTVVKKFRDKFDQFNS